MNEPCISVILPVYNGERFLAEAIQSILDQTLPPDEIIVVDDGSTDGSAEIAAQIKAASPVPIQLIQQSNQGPAAARNAGLQHAVGSFIAFQDADDLWSAEKLATQVALLQRYPNAYAVIGYSQIVLTDPDAVGITTPYGQPGPILLLQEGLFRRSIFDLVGQFDPRLRGDEDVEWFLHLLEQPVELIIHPDVVLTYRRHTENLTGSLAGSRHQFLLALQRSVVRRRQSPQANARTATVTFANASSFRQDEEKNGST
ncbi:glycosyltransferase family A protein [Candidatus Chloroploca sp. Khr17]|uniref:glycosyltransferase family 2 protein n=1 Tax=Candidatus Chloroploca sp. Khr17 TaxID=2496869 RepID=UPI00101D6F86|nr:glycosyltransferase family A protein [Candidatus Chloroploca sp. Khr17]